MYFFSPNVFLSPLKIGTYLRLGITMKYAIIMAADRSSAFHLLSTGKYFKSKIKNFATCKSTYYFVVLKRKFNILYF